MSMRKRKYRKGFARHIRELPIACNVKLQQDVVAMGREGV